MNLPVAKLRVQEQIMVHLQYLMQTNLTAAKKLADRIAEDGGGSNNKRPSPKVE
ncbi:MAG TPA: hypothetical protein VGY98_10070 [Verrucomicrobiae bacterium]|nr:hypothetical protein [Verrucomicrobiae bacterium]